MPEAAPAAPLAEAAPLAAEHSVTVEPSAESSPGPVTPPPPSLSEAAPPPPAPSVASTSKPEHGHPGFHRPDQRGRRRRWRGRSQHGEHRGSPRPASRNYPPALPQDEARSFEILPGESLAKYSHGAPAAPMGEALTTAPPEKAPFSDTPSATPLPQGEALPEFAAEPRHA